MAYSLGVDLGTTFVAAAMCEGSQPEMVTLSARSVVMPSAVYLSSNGRMVCGEVALRQALTDPGRAAQGFKRRLGDPIPVRLGGESRQPTALLGALLSEVLRVVTETEGAPPEQVMLTHPASWGPFRRGVFEDVALEAGLGDAPTVTEPAAAAAHYAACRNLVEGEIVAVYDLGGGTFDVTVLRAHPDQVEILGVPEGVERLGGIDFDESLYAHIDHESGGALSALDLHEPRAGRALARLRQDCVLAKEALSIDSDTIIPVLLPDQSFDVKVTRDQFEDLIRAQIESTVGALERTLRSAHLAPSDVDAVLLVGGSSRIPLVAKMVTDAIGAPTVVDTHPKYAVALGAARLATQTGLAASHAPAAPLPLPVIDVCAAVAADSMETIAAPAVSYHQSSNPPMVDFGAGDHVPVVEGVARPEPDVPFTGERVPAPAPSRVDIKMGLRLVTDGRTITVPPGRFMIGRDTDVQLNLANPRVSRHHAVLEYSDGVWTFTDTSTNGTFLGGRSVSQLRIVRTLTLCLGDKTEGATIQLIPDIAAPVVSGPPTDDFSRAVSQGQLTAVYSLSVGRLRIGRLPDNDVVLDDPLISRRHAELRRTPGGWQLVDLNSGNGTFVNGCRMRTAAITPRDVIGLGQSLFQLDGDRLVQCFNSNKNAAGRPRSR
ncbi:MAG TPA: Hsp70 family protein [Pseudonocardiaceae bacterium]|nr:Hsp70 family protein [Pseudonocardiaceae bacterium]